MNLSDDEQANALQPVGVTPASARFRRFLWKRLLLALILLVVLASSVGGAASPSSTARLPPLLSVKTFQVPFVPKYDPGYLDDNNPTMELHQIITGPDGNLYFLPDFGNWIGRITPDGQVSRFLLPLPPGTHLAAWAGLSEGGGSIWASELFGDGLWRLDPQIGTVKDYERIGQSKNYQGRARKPRHSCLGMKRRQFAC